MFTFFAWHDDARQFCLFRRACEPIADRAAAMIQPLRRDAAEGAFSPLCRRRLCRDYFWPAILLFGAAFDDSGDARLLLRAISLRHDAATFLCDKVTELDVANIDFSGTDLLDDKPAFRWRARE